MVDKFKDITEEEIDTFLSEFMKANFNTDDDKDNDSEWCSSMGPSMYTLTGKLKNVLDASPK